MFIDQQAAQKIVDRAMKIIGHNVNVMNHLGVIVGSGDPLRIGSLHEGALHVLSSHSEVGFSAKEASLLSGVQGGINLPIVCNGETVGVAGITGDPDKVRKYADLVVMTAELMVEQAGLTAQVQWDKRQREGVIGRLIQGEFERDSMFDDRIERLGIDLTVPRIAVVIKIMAEDGGELPLEKMQYILRLLDSCDPDSLAVISEPTQLVVLPTISIQDGVWNEDRTRQQLFELCSSLKKQNHLNFKVGQGQYFPSLEGLSKSYRSALKTLDTGRVCRPDQQVYFPRDLVLDMILKQVQPTWEGEQLISEYQKLIVGDKNGVLRKTLITYFEQNTDFGLSAKALHIHRNTLRYRLDKIEGILGFELSNWNSLVRFYLAFRLDDLSNTLSTR
ncbi:sugar diacid recognition domain-containing protein [Marinomonas sp. TI.3.20]|uniref:sugar diacid recognition domain-containing protein n=1 Tax=Marinomonas sp. TI.3.20 TaxID=3121296 RepID=UPI00311D82C8